MATIDMPVREALNQAIDEEMERDDAVYIMGEEVAQYQGAYKVTKGENIVFLEITIFNELFNELSTPHPQDSTKNTVNVA